MIRKLTLFLVAVLGIYHSSFAQECAFDKIHHQLLNSDPAYAAKVHAMDSTLNIMINASSQSLILNTANGPVYDIPVVIHVINTGGALGTIYNPTDASLQAMITYMNQVYAASYASYPLAGSGGTYFPIQFSLAKRDPNCNATTGIEHINGSAALGAAYTNYGVNLSNTNGVSEASVKALSDWNRRDYYNIWIVDRIDGLDGTVGSFTAGYAYLPPATATIDGTILLATRAQAGIQTLPHEMAHAFNILHVFEGDDPGNTGSATTCPANSNCNTDGDQVCDTEPMERNFGTCPGSTSTNPCTGTTWANTQYNIMDYSSCRDRFTPGQKTRFVATLNGFRASLISSLGATTLGTAPAAYTCAPGINYPFNVYDAGPSEVRFNDLVGTTEGGYNSDGNVSYIDRACIQRANVIAGQTYTIYVKTGANPERVRVYIDYNNDGVFNTTTELAFSHNGTTAYETHSGNITIPSSPSVTCVPIRMRVVSDLVVASAAPTPCGALDYGQAEDYSLVIRPSAPSVVTVALAAGYSNPSCTGTAVGFNATYTGAPTTPSLRWYLNGVYTGTTGSSYTASTFSNGDIVTAKLFYTGACGSDSVASVGYTVVRSSSVAPTVSIAVTAGTNPGCVGAPITFTATPTNGGTGPIYTWYVGATIQTGVTNANFTTSSLPCGSAVKAVLTSNATCASTTTATSNIINYTCGTLAVSVSIAVTSGSNPSCQGLPVTFTATPVNGGTAPAYRWFKNGVVTGVTTSTYTSSTLSTGDSIYVELYSNYSCATTPLVNSPATYIVIIPNVTPSVSKSITAGSNPGCKDSLIQFTANTANAGSAPSYRWYVNGVFSGVTTAVYNNTTAVTGDKIFVRAIPSGIGSACYSVDTVYSDTTTLTRLATPALPVISFIGHQLVADSSDVTWYGPAGLLPGGISQTYTPTVQGSYYAIIQNALCGGGKSNVLIVSPLMVGTYNMSGVQMVPNPTTGKVTISWTTPGTTRITVFTPSGQAIMQDVATVTNQKVLDLSNLASGIYFVMLQDEHGNSGTMKVTLTH